MLHCHHLRNPQQLLLFRNRKFPLWNLSSVVLPSLSIAALLQINSSRRKRAVSKWSLAEVTCARRRRQRIVEGGTPNYSVVQPSARWLSPKQRRRRRSRNKTLRMKQPSIEDQQQGNQQAATAAIERFHLQIALLSSESKYPLRSCFNKKGNLLLLLSPQQKLRYRPPPLPPPSPPQPQATTINSSTSSGRKNKILRKNARIQPAAAAVK